jgi:hypothetical protein
MSSAVNLFPRVHSNVEDTAKVIAETVDRIHAARPKSALDRKREQESLARELANLQSQLQQREHVVRVLTPVVASSKHQVKQLKAVIAKTDDRDELAQLERKLWRAESDLKNESERLACSTKLVESLTKLISEFHERNKDFAGGLAAARAIDEALGRPGSISGGGYSVAQAYAGEPK